MTINQPPAPATGVLTCSPPITAEEWTALDAIDGGPQYFTPVEGDGGITTITVTGRGDTAAVFEALHEFVKALGTTPPRPREDPGGPTFMAPDSITPFHEWRTFNGRIDGVRSDGAPFVWGVGGHDVVDLRIDAPEPMLDVLETINAGTVEELRWNGEGYHFIDVLSDLQGVLGEYLPGLSGAVPLRILFATVPPEGSPDYEAACELTPEAVAAYTTSLLAQAIGIADAWAQRIAARAAERGIARGDLSDPVVQAKALTQSPN
jgi:hypothetical protein